MKWNENCLGTIICQMYSSFKYIYICMHIRHSGRLQGECSGKSNREHFAVVGTENARNKSIVNDTFSTWNYFRKHANSKITPWNQHFYAAHAFCCYSWVCSYAGMYLYDCSGGVILIFQSRIRRKLFHTDFGNLKFHLFNIIKPLLLNYYTHRFGINYWQYTLQLFEVIINILKNTHENNRI
jgi:hypothetical protein